MELALSLFNLFIGILIAFVGFKKINPLSGKTHEQQVEFYRKWGPILKTGGIAIAAVGFLRLCFMF